MPTGVRRLNRRRYRESVAALKEIIGDQKAPALRKLRAIDVLLGIYDKNDRSEAAKDARRKAVGAPDTDGQPQPSTDAPGTVEEDVDTFLARIRGMKQQETENDEQD